MNTNEPKATHDPENYRKVSEPHADPDSANKALVEFLDGVRELRKKHKITNLLMAISVNVIYGTRGEGEAMTSSFFGDSAKAESLAAYALGKESARRREAIARLLKEQKGDEE